MRNVATRMRVAMPVDITAIKLKFKVAIGELALTQWQPEDRGSSPSVHWQHWHPAESECRRWVFFAGPGDQ